MSEQKTKHTPGPWEIQGGLTKYSACIGIHGDGVWIGDAHGDHCHPATRPHAGFPSNNEANANALLIAAAPDLLEACIDAVEEIEQSERCGSIRLKTAIAKAKGEENEKAI